MTRSEIEQLGFTVQPRGTGWRIVGPAVDLIVANLAMVNRADLRPAVVGAWDRSAQERPQ